HRGTVERGATPVRCEMKPLRPQALAVALACAALSGCGDEQPGNGDDLSVAADLAARDTASAGDRAVADHETRDGSSAGPGDGAGGDLIAPDLTTPVGDGGGCLGTAQSCGPGENCVDCTGLAAGSACIGASCGCNLTSDCPPGRACDPGTHRCTASCKGG